MRKKIRLSETALHNIVKETVKRIIYENVNSSNVYDIIKDELIAHIAKELEYYGYDGLVYINYEFTTHDGIEVGYDGEVYVYVDTETEYNYHNEVPGINYEPVGATLNDYDVEIKSLEVWAYLDGPDEEPVTVDCDIADIEDGIVEYIKGTYS